MVAWKADRAVVSLNWPPRSPDLIPLENVWGIMKRRIRSLAKQPETLIDLEQCVVNEWNAISCILLKNLYNGIQAKGYPIRKGNLSSLFVNLIAALLHFIILVLIHL